MKKPQKPFVLGLTGSIASGKTAVLETFKQCGLFTLSADEITHEILSSSEVGKILEQNFGTREPALLAGQVFKDAQARKRLEQILHPRILKKARERLAKSGAKVAVFEVPLLFEAGWDKYTDLTLLVRSSGADITARLKQRGLSPAQYRARLKTQLPEEKKAALADLIIINNSTKQHLEQKVRRLASALNHIYG